MWTMNANVKNVDVMHNKCRRIALAYGKLLNEEVNNADMTNECRSWIYRGKTNVMNTITLFVACDECPCHTMNPCKDVYFRLM